MLQNAWNLCAMAINSLIFTVFRIKILFVKCLKSLYRQQSVRRMAMWSTCIVLGVLYLMWYLSQSRTLKYLTSGNYAKLNFDLECEFKLDAMHPVDSNATHTNTTNSSFAEQPTGYENRDRKERGHTVCKSRGPKPDPAASSSSPSDILLNLISYVDINELKGL